MAVCVELRVSLPIVIGEVEVLERNVRYRCFLRCEVAHGMPWSVDQPVRNVYVCMLSLAERYWRLVLGPYSKALGAYLVHPPVSIYHKMLCFFKPLVIRT
jgi:hypothetical protein